MLSIKPQAVRKRQDKAAPYDRHVTQSFVLPGPERDKASLGREEDGDDASVTRCD